MTVARSAEEVTRTLFEVLEVKEAPERGFGGAPHPDFPTFSAVSNPHPGGHVYGGEIFAQALMAAGSTVSLERVPHFASMTFHAAASAVEPLFFTVDKVRDGASFSARNVRVWQDSTGVVADFQSSFQERQVGPRHGEVFAHVAELPEPESLPSTFQLLSPIPHPVAQFWASERPFDIRHVSQPLYGVADPEGASEGGDRQLVWLRALSAHPEGLSSLMRAALVAYVSDYTPFEPVLRRQGLHWLSPTFRAATLNHTMHFHGDVDLNQWHVYEQHSPVAGGGRALSLGSIFGADGTLLVTVSQEGMFREVRGA